jgi:hypothetical protein
MNKKIKYPKRVAWATKYLKKNLQARWPRLSLRVAASCPAAGAVQRPAGHSTPFQAYPGISLVDPDSTDPNSQSGSGSRRAKMAHKNREQLINFIF